MDLLNTLIDFNASGFEKINTDINNQIAELEEKNYIFNVLHTTRELQKKIDEKFFPENSSFIMISSYDYDIGNIIEIKTNISTQSSQHYIEQCRKFFNERFDFLIHDKVLPSFPEKTQHIIPLDSSALEKIQTILLTPEMRAALRNAQLELSLPQGSSIKKNKI